MTRFSTYKQYRFKRPVYICSCCHGNGTYVSLTKLKQVKDKLWFFDGEDDVVTVQLILILQLSLKTQQRFSVFGTCFDVSNIIISHYKCMEKIYKMISIYNYKYKIYSIKNVLITNNVLGILQLFIKCLECFILTKGFLIHVEFPFSSIFFN